MTQIDKGIQLVEQGDVTEGLELIKNSLATSDDNTKYSIGLLFQDWGFIQEALDLVLDLQKKYPEDSQLRLMLSEIYIDMDQEDKAIDILLSIQPDDDNFLSAELLLADLYQLQGLDEVAENKLKQAFQAAPSEPVIQFALGEFYLSTGQPKEAIPYYQAVYHAHELEHENISLKLAEATSLSGQFEEALPYYKEGLKKTKSLDGLFGYAITASQLEEYDIVISALEELKELDPQYTTLYPILAHAYKEQGILDLSLSTLEAGLKIDEHNDRLYFEAAKLAEEMAEVEKAQTYLKKVIERDPENVEAFRRLVSLYETEEDFSAIIDLLTQSSIDDPDLSWSLAHAYMEEDEIEEAIKYYEEAHTNFKNHPAFLKEYGEVLLQIGKTKEALSQFREALSIDPTDDELQLFIDRLEDNIT